MELKFISYNGKYPNLRSGTLIFQLDDKQWEIDGLSSGGSVWFDEDWNANIEEGKWSIHDWPDGFPEECKVAVVEMVNNEVPFGCCGGCV